MMPPIIGELPFNRGLTAAEGLITPTSTYRAELEGRAYYSEDSEHDSNQLIVLLCVRNLTGSAITVARKCGEFKTTAALAMVSQMLTFPCDTAGAVALPIDDAYAVGASIPANDLFYVVLQGWCDILTGAAVTNLSAGIPITVDNAGLIANKAQPAAGEFVLGKLEYASSYTGATATTVWVDPPALVGTNA